MLVLSCNCAFSDFTKAVLYLEQDVNDVVSGCQVTVPAGHIAQVTVTINKPGNVAGTFQYFFPGGGPTPGSVAPAGGSVDTITFARSVPANWDYAVGISAAR